MKGLTNVAAGAYTTAYPWSSLSPGARVVDVAGGIGHASMEIGHAYSHLHFIIQDLPGTIEVAKQVWSKEFPEALEQERISFQGFNFFKDSPVKGCEIYYFRFTAHNWNDEDCKIILKNISNAMTERSRLLIHDYVLSGFAEENKLELNPTSTLGPAMDVAMLAIMNSKERTLQHFKELTYVIYRMLNNVVNDTASL